MKSNRTDLRAQLQEIVDTLLRETNSSRTTLRIKLPFLSADTTRPFVEALQPNVGSLLDKVRTNQEAVGTVQFLKRERRLLIQPDTNNTNPGEEPPRALIDEYGTLAQMLGGIYRDDDLIGWLSVHENRGTRAWTDQDADALKTAVERTKHVLEGG
jgi:GAF domain-containing protein